MSCCGTSCPVASGRPKADQKPFNGIVIHNFNNLHQNSLPGSLCAFPGHERGRIEEYGTAGQ